MNKGHCLIESLLFFFALLVFIHVITLSFTTINKVEMKHDDQKYEEMWK